MRVDNQATKELDKATNSLKKMGDQLTGIGTKMTVGITTPLVGMGVAMMKTFADFESVMTEIGARTGATAEEMKKMSDFAIKMGRDTKFSATEAAQALLELTSSGQSAAQAMKTLPAVLALAAAGSIELGRAADGVTDILAQFQLEVKESAAVADILTKAAGSSSATVESLIQAFNNVGPVAKMFGMSVADTAAALAVLHENGIKGAEAGTNLKSMLQNMARDTEPVAEAWRELGLSLYDAQGNMRNMDDLFKDINKAMEGMSIEEQNRLAQDLAGSYGILAFQSLRTANGFSAMRDQMNGAAGAEEVAAEMSKTLAGRWEQLMGSIETLAIVLGQMVAGPLGDFLGWLTEVVNGFSSWAEANPAMAQTVMILLAIVAALGPLLVIIGQLMSAFVAIKAFFVAFPALLALLSNPLGWFVAISALVVAAILNNWFGLRDGLIGIFTWIVNGIHSLGPAFSEFGAMLANIPSLVMQGWGMLLTDLGTTIHQLIMLFGKAVGDMMVAGYKMGSAFMEGLWNGIVEGFKKLIVWILSTINDVVTKIRNAFGIASPSKVMAKIGEQVVAGFHEGIQSMGGIGVNVPSAGGSIQSRQPSLAVAGAGGGGGNTTWNIYPPMGTSEQQIDYIMREVDRRQGRQAERRGAKKIR